MVDRRPADGSIRWGRQAGGWIAGAALGMALASVALLPFAETYRAASGLVRAGRSAQSEWTLPVASLPSLAGPLATRALVRQEPAKGELEPQPSGLPYAGSSVIVLALVGAWKRRQRWLTWALAATIAVELARIFGGLPVSLAGVPLVGSVNFVKYCFPLYLGLALLAGFAFDGWRRASGGLVLVALMVELVWSVPRTWAERTDPLARAPWVEALQELIRARPGRISGPVDLAPPLVSSALGLHDLRSIDVLTPRATYDFVSRLVAPSQGVTWILADPDPLVAATGPGASVANLRWVVARHPLDASALPRAVRSTMAHLRLIRLLDDMEDYSVETERLSGGLHEADGERRFHWICETPCRFRFTMHRMPKVFAVGLSSPRPEGLRVALRADESRPGPARGNDRVLQTMPSRWSDVHVETAGGGAGVITLELASDSAATVFVGGVGPALRPDAESRAVEQELRHREQAFARLTLRHADEVAYIYENPDALGAAFLAEKVEVSEERDAVFDCLREHAGAPVACLQRADIGTQAVPAGSRGEVRVREDASDRVSFEIAAATPGLLVVTRLGDPGWRAEIDGQEAETLRANDAMMAIRVPAGLHRVDLRYAPVSVVIGGAISLAALVVLLALFVSPTRVPRSVESESRSNGRRITGDRRRTS
jgi:hypothetical protein